MAEKVHSAEWGRGELTETEKEKIREGFRRLERNSRFFDSHSGEWRQQYPDMYLAVYQEELVCAAVTGEDLISRLIDQNIPIEECYCKFLPSRIATLAPANRAELLD